MFRVLIAEHGLAFDVAIALLTPHIVLLVLPSLFPMEPAWVVAFEFYRLRGEGFGLRVEDEGQKHEVEAIRVYSSGCRAYGVELRD